MLGAGGIGAGLGGCSAGRQDGTATQTDGGGDTATGTDNGEKQLEASATIALENDPTADTWAVYGGVMPYYTNILEPLVWVSPEMEKEPWLAKSWERTGEKTFEFTIRDGVTFHNGESLTAEEVVWSFETILDEWEWAAGWLHTNPNGVKAIDDTTVEFTLDAVFPTFPGTVAHNMVAIQHPDRDRENLEPIGTGPYEAKQVKKGQRVKTSAFEDYWGGAAKTKELTFRVLTDANTRSLALSGNRIDLAFEPPRNKVKSLRNSEETRVLTQLSPSAGWVEIQTEKAPTSDVKLRKGLNYAVDQQAIVDSVLSGIGQPARGVIAPSIYWSAHDKLPEYGPNQQKAQSLVEKSAYDGETLQFLVNQAEPVNGKLMAEVIMQDASDIGVDVEIQVLEDAAYTEEHRAGNGHLFLTRGGTNSAAADYLLYDFFLSEDRGGCCSAWYQLGEEFDSLVIEGNTTADTNKKEEVYGTAQRIMMEKGAVIPLYYEEYVVGAYRDIEGLDLRPIPEMSRWPGLEHLK